MLLLVRNCQAQRGLEGYSPLFDGCRYWHPCYPVSVGVWESRVALALIETSCACDTRVALAMTETTCACDTRVTLAMTETSCACEPRGGT